jgi:hypothetical protein
VESLPPREACRDEVIGPCGKRGADVLAEAITAKGAGRLVQQPTIEPGRPLDGYLGLDRQVGAHRQRGALPPLRVREVPEFDD